MTVTRLLSNLGYLAGTGIWALLMLLVGALKCDDACGGPSSTSWAQNPDAWQYTALPWLGLAGVTLAVAAVAASWARPRLAFVAYCAHLIVFTVNAAILLNRPIEPPPLSDPRFVIPVLLTAAAGALTVMLAVRSGPRSAPRGAPRATS